MGLWSIRRWTRARRKTPDRPPVPPLTTHQLWMVSLSAPVSRDRDAARITLYPFTRPDDDGEDYVLDPLVGLDPEQLVRDAVGVELPFSPLCREDCLGLCEVCGGNRNLGECPGHESVDPRFAVLSELFGGGAADGPEAGG